jgi:ADP-ribose pyrophosphatase
MDKAVEIIETDTLYRGFLELRRYRLRHRLFEGGWSPELVRERVEGLRAASVLLYDPARDEVVLIEQFRIGAMDSENGAWVLETVGGYVPPDEAPEAVARREVREETGCAVGDLVPICEFAVSPGFSTERISLFCGRVDAGAAGGVHGLDEEGEDIMVRVLPADDAIGGIGRGGIDSTSVIIGLQWLAVNRDDLRRRWASD